MTSLDTIINDTKSILGQILSSCEVFKSSPTIERGEKIIKIIENFDKKVLQMKEEIVIIVSDVANKEEETEVNKEVEVFPTNNGFRFNVQKEQKWQKT